MFSRLLTVFLALALAAPAARADTDYFDKQPETTAIKVRRSGKRTPTQLWTIGGLAAGGLIAGGVGAYFHLDSRDAAGSVSSDADRPIDTWTDAHQARLDRADASGRKAGISYGVSAAFLIGAVVAGFLTQPTDEEVVIEPTRRGAMVGKVWRW